MRELPGALSPDDLAYYQAVLQDVMLAQGAYDRYMRHIAEKYKLVVGDQLTRDGRIERASKAEEQKT